MNRFPVKINPPKFKIGRFVYNEYEIREIMAQIAEGIIPFETVKHLRIREVGANCGSVQFTEEGRLTGNLPGLSISAYATKRVLLSKHYTQKS